MSPLQSSKLFAGRLNRRGQGHIILEFTSCALFLLIFTYVCADAGFLIFGAAFNDRACRDAARAAAQGTNLADATKRANSTLKAHRTDGAIMSSPVLAGPIVYQDYGGTPPAQTSAFVTVTTTTTIKLPFAPISFFGGVSFNPSGNMTFNQSYSFPIVSSSTSVN